MKSKYKSKIKINFLKVRLIKKQLKELNIHYLFGSGTVFQTQTCLRTKCWLEDVIVMVQINNVIILMLRIELAKVDKLQHKIDFKLFFLRKTACANINLLEQYKYKRW